MDLRVAATMLDLRWTYAGKLDSCWTTAGLALDCCCAYDGPACENAMPELTTASMACSTHVRWATAQNTMPVLKKASMACAHVRRASTRTRNAGAHDGKHGMACMACTHVRRASTRKRNAGTHDGKHGMYAPCDADIISELRGTQSACCTRSARPCSSARRAARASSPNCPGWRAELPLALIALRDPIVRHHIKSTGTTAAACEIAPPLPAAIRILACCSRIWSRHATARNVHSSSTTWVEPSRS